MAAALASGSPFVRPRSRDESERSEALKERLAALGSDHIAVALVSDESGAFSSDLMKMRNGEGK